MLVPIMNKMTCCIKNINFITLILCLTLCGCQKLDLKTIDGHGIKLRDRDGRWLALNIWASWCYHCRKEMPELNALNKQGDIRVAGHDFDAEKGEALKDKIKDLGIEFPIIIDDPFLTLPVIPPKTLPVTYIINPEGILVDTLYGSKTQEEITFSIKNLQHLQ